MLSLFFLYRLATFALFIVCNTVICSVAAWNLGFAHTSDFSTLARIDSFLIFAGASGLVVVFSVVFVEIFRRGAVSSRVWFEMVWLMLFWLLNFVGAIAVTAVGLNEFCSFKSDKSHSSGSACTSARVLIVFAWLNAAFLFVYFLLLTVFSVMHQKEDTSVWHSTVCEFPWFKTRQCIRSAPSSPIVARFVKSKSPSLVVPKPRRAPPPPLFIHGRAGLSSQVEIEHFADIGSLEEQPLPPPPPASVHAPPPPPPPPPPPATLSFYPQHVQSVMQAPTTYQSNTYLPSDRSPPPIRNWPRPIGAGTPSQVRMSERTAQKQRDRDRDPSVPRRSDSNASSSNSRSRNHRMRAPALAPPPLSLERTTTKESASASVSSAQNSPSRSRPTGPRSRSGSMTMTATTTTAFVRPRPPPLDLTRNGSTPNVRR